MSDDRATNRYRAALRKFQHMPLVALLLAVGVALTSYAAVGQLEQRQAMRPKAVPPPPSLLDAHIAYHRGQFRQALAIYEKLAAQGDAEAAERAGIMRLLGTSHYGNEVTGDYPEAMRLLGEAASEGRAGASALLNALDVRGSE